MRLTDKVIQRVSAFGGKLAIPNEPEGRHGPVGGLLRNGKKVYIIQGAQLAGEQHCRARLPDECIKDERRFAERAKEMSGHLRELERWVGWIKAQDTAIAHISEEFTGEFVVVLCEVQHMTLKLFLIECALRRRRKLSNFLDDVIFGGEIKAWDGFVDGDADSSRIRGALSG
jgi:hypothetical protein